ncbi:MAG: efflux RND transporter permease subunit [Candidatus Saelkia tenebricola]|nr:efflux RND transporter permease subunit [Candidatus Saelkia tenebricola]
MKISEFSVKHSLLINLISVFILIAGFYTVFISRIRKEAFPEISFDKVIITTMYPGATPEEVEKLVTTPIEKELKGVDGIEEFDSTSTDNLSTISVEINEDVKDKTKVIDDIQQAVDRIGDLPDDVKDDPLVIEVTSGEIPIVKIALSGEISERDLQEHAEKLEDILEDIEGVSSIAREGWRDEEVWIEVDPEKLKNFHLSIEEIMQALAQRNIGIPGGKIRAEKEFNIRTTGEFYKKEEIENVIIRANDIGNWLRVKDVGTVRFTFEEENEISKSFATRSITLTVIKRSSGDAIRIVDQIKKEISKFKNYSNPNLHISYIDDMSFYVRRRLGVLRQNGIIGILLVLGVLLFFLDHKTAFLTALGLPIAFSITLAIMGFSGLSINLISMFGLIVVLGMIVDDGIIIAENCSRHIESGMSPRKAAVIGTEEVIKPVTTTIITTIAAFSPLLFMGGMIGKFIRGIPITVIIALVASLFEALIILPSHIADFVKVKVGEKIKSKKETPWFKKLLNFYTNTVIKALNKRYLVLLILFIVLLLTFVLFKIMPFILFGSQGTEQFYIRAEAPIGTNLYKTEKLTKQIEEKVKLLPKNELDAFTTQIGSSGQSYRSLDPYGKSGSHTTQVTVYLTPNSNRKRKVNQIIETLREELKDIKGFKKTYFEKEKEGPPIGKAIAVQIRGEEFNILEEIANEINILLNKMKGVTDITSDYEMGQNEIKVIIDEEKAAQSYLSTAEIASSIRNVFRGGIATSIKPTKATEEIDVLVIFPQDYRNKKDTFNKILIPNKFNNLIPLEKVSRLEEHTTLNTIRHLDGKRIVTIRAEVDNKNITSAKANNILAKQLKNIPVKYPGYNITFGGEQEENIRSTRDFMQAFAMAFFLIFMILAANFNSLIQPFVVMMAIPFGLIGVIWAFFFHGLPISFFTLIGIVGLTGIVVNDSIVLVEFINNLRRQGVDRRESIIQGGQLRLRPVLLTTITTALGLTPTAYGIWGGDPFLRPMALTIVWGIICATALTLIVIPCIYAIIDDITLKLAGHTTVKKNATDNNTSTN